MKKIEIISEYNNLASELQTVNENYKAVTGKDYIEGIVFQRMDPSICLSWGKEELEVCLLKRQQTIANCKRDTDVYRKTEEMKSTEEGRNFIKMLEESRETYLAELHLLRETFRNDFNRLLTTAGLEEWAMIPSKRVIPSFHTEYFSLYNKTDKWANLHVSINRENGKWVMTVNCGLRGSNDITDRGDQYKQFKAYVTICDNCDAFQAWMENTYCELAHQAYDILNQIEQLDEDIKYPYDAWVKANS